MSNFLNQLNTVTSKQSSIDSNLTVEQQQQQSAFNQLEAAGIVNILQNPILNAAAANAVSSNTSPILNNNSNIPAHVLQAIIQQQQAQTQLDAQLKIESLDAKKGAVPIGHPDAEKWFYLDPQNQIQGGFTSEEMAGWFAAGYFSLSLMIRRGCDDQFLPLGIYLAFYFVMNCSILRFLLLFKGVVGKNWGRLPFTVGPQMPPLKVNVDLY